ncbi:hypothetical protein D7Z26_08165 [Cohnella endophytica]|uniref:Anti-sigma-W factor RsiW n=1 Tax=Cohnella endophytica TaxID=2419778 RepID=A0A494Y1D5_9BACL|nr:zf-HC2 domain-containing protein [Cohnella endophytica]RKP55183.1 hypothetical protein D7Z26_08165 [Cohnella endophytica]
MNCQEVMELMQRYIDGDLDQQETSLMMDHTGQCPDCAAMLVRLQKLSSELEQLPRVVPKFSLVDAIMPELERLHAASDADGGDHARESAVKEDAPKVTRSQRPTRHLYGKISGVVAAGIVAGLLLFGQPDKWLLTGNSHNDASSEQSSMASDLDSNAPQAANRSLMKSEAADKMKDEAGLAAEEQQKVTGLSQSIPESPTPSSALAGADKAPSKLDAKSGGSQFSIAEQPSASSSPAPELAKPGITSNGLTAIPATLSESPDGKWQGVAIEGDGTFQVIKKEDNSLFYSSQKRDGKIGLLSWSDDSAVLYFTYTDAEGTPSQWEFDTTTGKETKR